MENINIQEKLNSITDWDICDFKYADLTEYHLPDLENAPDEEYVGDYIENDIECELNGYNDCFLFREAYLIDEQSITDNVSGLNDKFNVTNLVQYTDCRLTMNEICEHLDNILKTEAIGYIKEKYGETKISSEVWDNISSDLENEAEEQYNSRASISEIVDNYLEDYDFKDEYDDIIDLSDLDFDCGENYCDEFDVSKNIGINLEYIEESHSQDLIYYNELAQFAYDNIDEIEESCFGFGIDFKNIINESYFIISDYIRDHINEDEYKMQYALSQLDNKGVENITPEQYEKLLEDVRDAETVGEINDIVEELKEDIIVMSELNEDEKVDLAKSEVAPQMQSLAEKIKASGINIPSHKDEVSNDAIAGIKNLYQNEINKNNNKEI